MASRGDDRGFKVKISKLKRSVLQDGNENCFFGRPLS